jgi:hypothetical protein
VVTSDRGHEPGGGFGARAIRIPGWVRQVDTVVRLVQAAL